MTDKRLIEVAFPLRQASIDSVHEKNVRHGHISTLHIWPARRPLAASRAALIATLLPDPGDKEKRDEILKRLGGTLKKTIKKKKMPNGRVEEIDAWETEGGVLHWGNESVPDMDWFRAEIRNAYGGRAPKVLDPFAGGGAIPLEAMRLGCEVTAVDINPVAWFILKCTLEYPQKLAGQQRRLPDFALQDPEFMAAYLKAKGLKPAQIKQHLRNLSSPAGGKGVGGEAFCPRPPAPLPEDLLAHAREMRKDATDAENLMWRMLRSRRLSNAKFRRQHPIGQYIVDFYCDEHRLVVELDGGQHMEQRRYDAERDGFLRGNGLTVLRFWNNEVLGQTEAVLERIWALIEKAKSPSPPAPLPLAGEGGRGETADLFRHEPLGEALFEADLAWHVRAWGHWVLKEARKDLARFYPTYAEYCTLKPYRVVPLDTHPSPASGRGVGGEGLKLVPTNDAGEPQVELLNAAFDVAYLENPTNPRWVAKPTVAYLWARTVRCKACRVTVPLLKTRWLAKKDSKRVLLTLTPTRLPRGVRLLPPSPAGGRGVGGEGIKGVTFGIDAGVEAKGGNAAQRREHDKRIGAGTMSRAGATCPCCGTIMTMEDLRLEGRAGRLGAVMTSVVVDSPKGKEYRLPTPLEAEVAQATQVELDQVFSDVPFGLPTEPLAGADALGFRVPLYGLDQWYKLFSPRQLLVLGTFVKAIRAVPRKPEIDNAEWQEAVTAYLASILGKNLDYSNLLCSWYTQNEQITHLFNRFALPMKWDYAETSPIGGASGSFDSMLDSVCKSIDTLVSLPANLESPLTVLGSATQRSLADVDVVVTDPPYYDAIPYSDLMDFFYVWHRRMVSGLTPEFEKAFTSQLAPKWDHQTNDGELIDDASRFGGNKEVSKRNYEAGMARAFQACHDALKPSGRLVIVFAHKQPDAWETLVSAIIKAGFVVDGSWPIQTEMSNRTRPLTSAALASSVWLVCRKRDPMVRAGWDTQVIQEMETNIVTELRDSWDAGIRGPDFVWAATGPALEAYSRYPAVKKASEPGVLMRVDEFLRHVRRIVVDFVVGRVLTRGEAEGAVGDHPLDDVTTYYLLHRNDFGLKEAPAGPCILYMVSCGLPERDLVDQYELLARGGGKSELEAEEIESGAGGDEADAEAASSGGGGKFKLKPWSARRHRSLGEDTAGGRPAPLIDRVHKLMHLWKAGDVTKVNDYLDRQGLRRSHVFAQLIQALIEKSRDEGQNDECSILERLANHLRAVGSMSQQALALSEQA